MPMLETIGWTSIHAIKYCYKSKSCRDLNISIRHDYTLWQRSLIRIAVANLIANFSLPGNAQIHANELTSNPQDIINIIRAYFPDAQEEVNAAL